MTGLRMTDDEAIGRALQLIRTECGIPQWRLAQLAKVGDHTVLSVYERGRRTVREGVLEALARELGVEVVTIKSVARALQSGRLDWSRVAA